MVVTADTSHDPMSWSKEEALSNMDFIFETADVSHAEMSGLHVPLPVEEPPPLLAHHDQALNRHCMSVIALTSQPEMWPYAAMAAGSLVHQRSTAACRAGLPSKVPGGSDGGGAGAWPGGYGSGEGGGSGSGSGGSGVPAADEASSERRKSTLATLGSEEVLCATGCAVLLFEMLRECDGGPGRAERPCAKTSRKRSVDYVTYHYQLCLSGLVVAIGRSVNVGVSSTQQLVGPCEFDRASAEPSVNHRPTADIEQLQAHRKHWRFIILTGQHLPRMRKV